jgi:NADPH:quinone reductase-like Zn-dependent oxidoreductase
MSDFLVRRDDLRTCRVVESATPELEEGQALLRVERFGLTANNITYAVFGDGMRYWDFFPTEDGWGRVPMWGFAEVAASRAEGVQEGTRVYGYLPPSTHLVVTPASADEHGFVDTAPHRKPLPSAYQRYLSTATDPFYTNDTEALQMLLRPLFYTSFLIDDALDDDGRTETGPILISSASSKTSLAAAFLLAQRPGVEIIGLTSSRSRAFVEALGIYTHTVAYDEVDGLDASPATFVDVAGDAAVRLAVHSHFGDQLAASLVVGATHWEELAPGAAVLPGPAPEFFFAPDRITKRGADWSPAGLNDRVATAWHPFREWVAGWLEPIEGEGFDAVQTAYLTVLAGHVDPATAHVLTI